MSGFYESDVMYQCIANCRVSTCWLQYKFESGTAQVSSYRIERLRGFGSKCCPVSWQMKKSLDNGVIWIVIDEHSCHSNWSDGEVKCFTPGKEFAHDLLYIMDVSENAGGGY